MDEQQAAIDVMLGALGHKAALSGGGMSFVSWLLSSQFGMVMGVLIGLSGLLMQWYFNRRRDKREQAEHEMRMKGSA